MSDSLAQRVSLSLSDLNRMRVPAREIARGIASNRHLKTVYVDRDLNVENSHLIYEAIYGNANIETLNFLWVDPMAVAGLSVPRMRHLKELVFIRIRVAVGADVTPRLQLNRHLQEVRVSRGNAGNAVAQAVARTLRFRSCLTTIEFDHCSLSNRGLAAIGQSLQTSSRVTDVILCENFIDVEDEAASELAQGIETNSSMHKLYLSFNRVHVHVRRRIICALTTNKTLKEVVLTIFEFGVEETIEAARLLKANTTLEKLRLSGTHFSFTMDELVTNRSFQIFRLNEMDTDVVRRVCNALVSDDTIEQLILRDGEVTADGIVAIGHMLSNNSTLKRLAIRSCRIDDDQIVDLSESFKLSQSLDSLDLSRNRIENRGAAAVADFVTSNPMIKKLDFSSNNIGDDGFGALGRALEHNMSLEELTVSNVADRGMRAILNGVKVHPAIKIVQVKGLSNTSYQDELDFYLERNKGPKRILHVNVPLSIWPLVLKRADECRQVYNRLRAPDMLHYFIKEKSELFARGTSGRKRKRTSP